MGNNTFQATGAFTPNANDAGKQVLNDFVSGKGTKVQVRGYGASTEVASLLEAFEGLELSTNLPGLNTSLLNSASLKGAYETRVILNRLVDDIPCSADDNRARR